MRIALNAGTLRGAGSSAVGQALLRALAKNIGPHRLFGLVPREWPLPSEVVEPAWLLKTDAGLGKKFWNESRMLPAILRMARCDVLLSLGDTSTPRPGVPHVLFVQQAFLAYPRAQWGFRPPARFAARMRAMALYFRAGLGGVTRFTVQTEDMKQHLTERWRVAPDRVAVIPSAVGDDVLARRHEPRSDPPRPHLIYVAGPGPHKNHAVLPGMLAAVATRHVDVRLQLTLSASAVPDVVRRARKLGVLDRIEFLGNIDRARALDALARAAVAVIPSQLESFGLGYYEALALGVPVVAAERGFAREACGNAARYAEASSPESFAAQVGALLDDAEARRTLSADGRRRFDHVHVGWDAIARRYLDVLEATL